MKHAQGKLSSEEDRGETQAEGRGRTSMSDFISAMSCLALSSAVTARS